MKNESPLPANTGLSLYQASRSRVSIFWGQGATQTLLQLPPYLPGKNASEQDQQPGGKMNQRINESMKRINVLGGSGNGAWDPKHKLTIPVGHTVERINTH